MSPFPALNAASEGRGRGLIAWFVPDLALTFALTASLSLFAQGGATTLFNDTDTGWHIRTGDLIISARSLPRFDPFSFSMPHEPWIVWEWGGEVLMSGVSHLLGLGGVALLFGLAIGVSVWMWFRLNQAAGGGVLFAGLLLIPTLLVTKMHWLARPHVFGWLFLLGTVWWCERMPPRLRWWHLALVAATTAVWANVHGSFFLGPLIVVTYAAGAYLKPLIWELQAASGGRYLLVALAAAFGTLANPYGWRLHQHLYSFLTSSGAVDHIGEFQSFNFHSDGATWIMLTTILCFAGGFASLAAQKPERFLLSMLLIVIALRSARAFPMAALLALPVANGSITAILSRTRNLTPILRRAIDNVFAYGCGLEVIDRRFRGFATVPLIAALVFLAIRSHAGFPSTIVPVAASVVVASLPLEARILSPDTFGSYLIYRFNGERKVFFDGRSDLYGADFLARYSQLIFVQRDWRKEFNRGKFTHALLPPEWPLIPVLEAYGWREIYRDQTAVLLSGPNPLDSK